MYTLIKIAKIITNKCKYLIFLVLTHYALDISNAKTIKP